MQEYNEGRVAASRGSQRSAASSDQGEHASVAFSSSAAAVTQSVESVVALLAKCFAMQEVCGQTLLRCVAVLV